MLPLPRSRQTLAALTLLLTLVGAAYHFATLHRNAPDSAEGLLGQADALSWNSRWVEAKPLYARAALLFAAQHQPGKVLYATVSQIPADESVSLPATILQLTQALKKPEAQEPEIHLRVLTIRGMLETNYDASEAQANWQEVRSRAFRLHHLDLATRAQGEEGIAAFLLGDTETAKKKVLEAWAFSKIERDDAATVRYAGVFGEGLAQVHRYKESLNFLDRAINLAKAQPELAYPVIAVNAKIGALAGLGQYAAAIQLANQSLARLQGTLFDGTRSQLYISRGEVERAQAQLQPAIEDYTQAVVTSRHIQNYRGIAAAAGGLAQTLEQGNRLQEALTAINEAINANARIPDELYLVPRNLATKAEIEEKMGRIQQSDLLYRKSIALIDRMILHASTVNIERQLLSEMSDVYSGYFASLCAQKRFDQALQILDNIRGRVETEALQHHTNQPVHPPTDEEKELTRLNLSLINADDPAVRESLTDAIYTTELRISPGSLTAQTIAHPVRLPDLQRVLSPTAITVEYVLAEPFSYALAITHDTVTPYQLPAKSIIEADSVKYRTEIHAGKDDKSLARKLFSELLGPVKQYSEKRDLIIVPDGSLHLLPFSALQDDQGYVLETHTVGVEPSCTVFAMLNRRKFKDTSPRMPYLGVAAWVQSTDDRNSIVRLVAGPQRSQLVPLPESKLEVETIANDLPKPNTILLGADATEGNFRTHVNGSTDVIHLALHGYADIDYPDRSALVFAPDNTGRDDGLLQVREIRALHLRAKLVTLSACNTGVGPVAEFGVVNLVNAFIEAGADSVVSTLWELEDHSTEHLMASFYSQLAAHKRKVDALRSAQLELLRKGLQPYSWASVQIVGDPDGIL